MAYMYIISEIQPTDVTEGLEWLQPSTGVIKMYLNASWVTVITGSSITYTIPLTIFIKGVDRTANIEVTSVKKADILTSKVDTFSFLLYDEDGSIQPTEGQEILVFKKESASATPSKFFAGEIKEVTPNENAPGQTNFTHEIRCVDYSKRLNKDLVVESYEDKTAQYIIQDILDNYATEFSYNNVKTGSVIDYIPFNYKSAMQCIKEVAQLTGYDWYVDYDRDVHFFDKTTNLATYQLDETASTGHYKNLKIDIDKSQLRNKVIVRGGIYLSAAFDDIREADGEQEAFNLAYKPREPVTVYVDVGAGFVAKTLGIDNIDTTGYDFVLNVAEKTIRNLDLAKLNAGDVFKANYKREIQVITSDKDQDSIDNIKEIEGGNGTYEHIVVDEEIDTIEGGHERGLAELTQYSNPIIKGSFGTDQEYRSGELLTIDMPTWGYSNRQFLIQKVTVILKGDNSLWYEIIFATKLRGLTDFLIGLIDAGKRIIIREEETIHDLTTLADESITITPGTPAYTRFTPPYKWGVDADQGTWGEAEWS